MRQKNSLCALSFFLFFFVASKASFALAPIPLATVSLVGDALKISPPPKHHFNDKAPTELKINNELLPAAVGPKEINAHLRPDQKNAVVQITYYVCDDGDKYCARASLQFDCATQKSKVLGAQPQPAAAFSSTSKKLSKKNKAGFMEDSPQLAFALAKQEKLPLVIDFTAIWCPDCDRLDREILETKEFQSAVQSKFVRLKVDVDSIANSSIVSKYKIMFFPTLLFVTSEGDEITRLAGTRPMEAMLRTVKLAYEHREQSFAKLQEKAVGGNKDAAVEAARIAYDQHNPELAIRYLEPYNKEWLKNKDERLELYFRAQLMQAESKFDNASSKKVLQQFLEVFPHSQFTIENEQSLAGYEEKNGQKDLAVKAKQNALGEVDRVLAHPELLKNMEEVDFSVAALREMRADLLSELGDKEKAKAAYLDCVQANEEAARPIKGFAKGLEQNRAYCLHEAGWAEAAEAIYREGIKKYPKEFVFYYRYGKNLIADNKSPQHAVELLQKALKLAYGNQRFRVVPPLATALSRLEKNTEALALLDRELAVPLAAEPDQGALNYHVRLSQVKAELQAKLAHK